jgi:endonuclease/exonuclease/phosphatase (EEP) superfamily protein YafD
MRDETLTNSRQPAAKRSRTQCLFLRLVFFFCLPTFLGFGARWLWILELAVHFRVQYVCVMIPLVILLLLQRRFKYALLPLIVLVINAAFILPLYFSSSQPAAGLSRFRAISANVYTANRNHQRFIDFVKHENPDFFCVMEVNERWLQKLHILDEDYPFSISQPRPDNFGIAFFSRVPVVDSRIIQLADSHVPTLIVKLKMDNRLLSVIGTHPLPPVSSAYAGRRNRQIAALGKLVSETSGPLVVMGDFNMTSWSPHFRDLLRRTGLQDSRRGFGVQPSWPQQRPWLFIPIDHALVSSEISVHNRYIGGNIGSDHRPIVIDFSISE